ncbi:hypothetical protein N2152v2_002479 [Parachlorella kessleri]
MKALRFSEGTGPQLGEVPIPEPQGTDALIKVKRAAICSTDLEILRGYVPGYNQVLGHEFVGVVDRCDSNPALVGQRVVGEINCRTEPCTHPDPIFVRNHAARRVVLGIIGKDGTLAEYCTLPAENLLVVPEELTDQEACFAEPLAAACRIVEQQVLSPGDKVAVIGDGKLGLLIAQLLVCQGYSVTHLGRHERKLALVEGSTRHVVGDTTAKELAEGFDVVVEATGSSQGIRLALAVTRPLGTIVLKSTCSMVGDTQMPPWSEIGNDVVVQEKRIVGSRCGPFQPALDAMREPRILQLLSRMVDAVLPIEQGLEALERAQQKGTLKVQVTMDK